MAVSVFRFRAPATVAIRERNGFRLKELSPGALFLAPCAEPDRNGMVAGTSNGYTVLVFTRDLEERAEPIRFERLQVATAGAS